MPHQTLTSPHIPPLHSESLRDSSKLSPAISTPTHCKSFLWEGTVYSVGWDDEHWGVIGESHHHFVQSGLWQCSCALIGKAVHFGVLGRRTYRWAPANSGVCWMGEQAHAKLLLGLNRLPNTNPEQYCLWVFCSQSFPHCWLYIPCSTMCLCLKGGYPGRGIGVLIAGNLINGGEMFKKQQKRLMNPTFTE